MISSLLKSRKKTPQTVNFPMGQTHHGINTSQFIPFKKIINSLNVGLLFEKPNGKAGFRNESFLNFFPITHKRFSRPKVNEIFQCISAFCKKPVTPCEAGHKKEEIHLNDGRIISQAAIVVSNRRGKPIGVLRIFEDVTHERLTTNQLFYLAEHDFLTGLYNRRHFQDEFSRTLDNFSQRNETGALLFFDLDEFKYVNDTFGHRAGDTMLIRVASEISTMIDENKVFGRLGGDEFAILIPNASQDEATEFANSIIKCISHIPFICEGQSIRMTTSVGIAMYPKDGVDLEQLISHADAALYQAKAAGKNSWRSYNARLDTSREMVNSLAWNDRISSALEENRLKLHFQGVYHTRSGQLSHAEVLVRMYDKDTPGKFIMPGQFIPIAERTGKILDIDRWVIREAIHTLAKNY
ncbi:MAG: diguanylate cyclase, partial [Gammaproteobacteria bacterium]|nr:diguanylate cyclase [Gammaproteobacteria bacterium]